MHASHHLLNLLTQTVTLVAASLINFLYRRILIFKVYKPYFYWNTSSSDY